MTWLLLTSEWTSGALGRTGLIFGPPAQDGVPHSPSSLLSLLPPAAFSDIFGSRLGIFQVVLVDRPLLSISALTGHLAAKFFNLHDPCPGEYVFPLGPSVHTPTVVHRPFTLIGVSVPVCESTTV